MDLPSLANENKIIIQEINAWMTDFENIYQSKTISAAKNHFACQEQEAVYTVCSKKHFAQMIGMAESLWVQHPNLKLYVCLSDNHDADTQKWAKDNPRAEIIEGKDLGISYFESFAFKYSIVEYTTALKPYTATYLFKHNLKLERLLYLDTDILIFHPLDFIFKKLQDYDLLLNFHYTEPYPEDYPLLDRNLLYSGIYNSGFYGLKRSKDTITFLNWWEKRLYNDCRIAPNEGIFIDQKWLIFGPMLVKNTYHLFEPGYNAAYWNVHEQQVTHTGKHWNDFEVKDKHPLYCFHFSGFQPQTPHVISRFLQQPKLKAEQLSALLKLGYFYAAMLKKNSNDEYHAKLNTYDFFDNGTPIPRLVKQIYQHSALQEKFPHPFATQGENTFFQWLLHEAQPDSQINNLLVMLYGFNTTWKKMFPNLFEQEAPFMAFIRSIQPQLNLPELFLHSSTSKIKNNT